MYKRKVCVVGAGAAGLCAIKTIKESPYLTGMAFEGQGHLGGIWHYTPTTGPSVHSAAYKGLRTNLPQEIMGYLDYPMNKGKTSFIMHNEVLEYLHDYAATHDLWNLIQFNTEVLEVRPKLLEAGDLDLTQWTLKSHTNASTKIDNFSNLKWEVTYKNSNDVPKKELFDAVMICNGHYSKPQLAKIKNIEKFPGEVMHSKDYRVPDGYIGQRVLLCGCGPSAIDMALEIVEVAQKLVISMRNPPMPGSMDKRIIFRHPAAEINNSTVVYDDGFSEEFDSILQCTGYEYEFPFLDPSCGLEVQNLKYVTPIFRQMINANYPTMAIIGIPFRVCPFLLFDVQARNFCRFLEGSLNYPSFTEMLQSISEEKAYRDANNIGFSKSHQLETLQWPYFEKLAKESGCDHLLSDLTRKIYEKVGYRRKHFPKKYKNDNIVVKDSDIFYYEAP